MITIINKSNRPIGVIGGQFCLPDQKITLKDKDAYCDVFDENDVRTGEKKLLPGLSALKNRGFIEIIEEPAKKAVEKPEPVVEEKVEEPVEEPVKKTTKKKTTKKTTE